MYCQKPPQKSVISNEAVPFYSLHIQEPSNGPQKCPPVLPALHQRAAFLKDFRQDRVYLAAA